MELTQMVGKFVPDGRHFVEFIRLEAVLQAAINSSAEFDDETGIGGLQHRKNTETNEPFPGPTCSQLADRCPKNDTEPPNQSVFGAPTAAIAGSTQTRRVDVRPPHMIQQG